VTSVVIPAHDEAAVIERCLDALLADARPGELEVVVVCNGCTDDTADRARRHGADVRVVETPVASKAHALNLGDEHVVTFPRVYLDADVVLTTAAVRDVVALLEGEPGVVVAAPTAVVDLTDRPWPVRAFYEVWSRLPYATEDMVGCGVYAFSREGRARFDRFPDRIADDEVARRVAGAGERRALPTSTFTIHPPRTLAGVLAVRVRVRAGNRQLAGDGDVAHAGDVGTGAARSLLAIARRPRLWARAPVYLGVTLLAERRARAKLRDADATARWERDDTSRLAEQPS
jgi:hypothetical protein